MKLGASFARHGELELPLEFEGWRVEYEALATGVAVADRSHRGRLRVTGRDRVSFLQNMLTNDVKSLPIGGELRAAFLTRQGKLVTDLRVLRFEDSLLLEMERDRVLPTREALSRYVVSEDATLTEESGAVALLSLEGPRAQDLLARVGGDAMRLARASTVPFGPGPSFDLALPLPEAPQILDELVAAGAVPAGYKALETRRIEAGIPRFGVDMDETVMALEAGLEGAISFTKGCYIGQEYVVRTAHRGHVNKKLVGLTLAGETVPEPGTPIAGERGHVTCAAFSPTLSCAIALGYVHRELMEPGTEVTVGSFPATVTALPFVRS